MQNGGDGDEKNRAGGEGGGQLQHQMPSRPKATAPQVGHHQHQQRQPPPPPPPPQQWMAMHHYRMMQNQMMAAAAAAAGAPPPMAQFVPVPPPPPPPRYVPYQQQYPHWGGGGGVGSEENRTIWVGDLLYWMDENYLHSCFAHTGQVVSAKVIRNKQTGQSEGYGFVEFHSHEAAGKVLVNYSSMAMPNTDIAFRLNWASFSMGERRNDAGSDLSIFVGDLASDVTDTLLQETFASTYTSVRGAKVVIDANTGRSKGYGFVRFGDENERTRALNEMNGVYCSSRAMRIGAATPRKSSGFPSNDSYSDGDSRNTTVFVGGLDPSASEEDLRQVFSPYGEIASVKIPVGKQCGFVHYIHRNNAEEALQRLNGTKIGKQTIRLSWGRNPANKQRSNASHQWNNAYDGRQVYDGYGYVASPHDPSMYTATYGGYPMYGGQQQVS